ncbi:UEV-domain-containing protein [Rickenella mellea]|uniref:UEV-domain-containing protein n=1 Tax=Rickenella mellea TaxID=50990 RepID=A0A4Y7QIS3_9AGAM|nr:UEV-domain-containing protein [Rickenella mellea]
MALSLTQSWLKQQSRLYSNSPRIYTDIDAALIRFPALRPKSDIYTYDDGRTQLLLCLHGLLPITFRRATYNIPVALWFPLTYPKDPPIVYVVPTTEILVRPSKHVDPSGRCTVDYMDDWLRKPEAGNLTALLEFMQEVFSRQPPVYAKPKAPSPAAATSSSPGERPSLPPKPSLIAATLSAASSPSPATPHAESPQIPVTQPEIRPPPPPRLPPQAPAPPPYASPPPLQQWQQPPQIQTQIHTTTQWQASTPVQQPPPPPRWSVPVPPTITSPPQAPPQNLLDEDTPQSQPPAPKIAPPRPPNPELLNLHAQIHQKLNASLSALHQSLGADTDRQRMTQRDLLAGEPALRDEMARLEAVRDVCATVSTRLRAAVESAEKNVVELRRKGDPEVDELVCSTSIVHNQLINLVAEDNAIEDTIYHLHRALNAGRIDLERFLRTTRVLAEEQFTKRALVEKILNGLPMGSSSAVGGALGGSGITEHVSIGITEPSTNNYNW